MASKRVAVIHPDLGIGGAERLIVDLSLALQDIGYEVTIFTSYHNRNRCFEETRSGKLRVKVVGSWIPRTILGIFHALMAYIKMIYIAFYLVAFSNYKLVVCDQVSACIPVFRLDLRNRPRILFYCHFPDQLLTRRETLLKSAYRKPLDWFEGWSTSLAHMVVVNSNFTKKVVANTFKQLKSRKMEVLYPCVDVGRFMHCEPDMDKCRPHIKRLHKRLNSGKNFVFLSLNRFERKKDLVLAIEALKHTIEAIESDSTSAVTPYLIVAGGHDERLEENVSYHKELTDLVDRLDLESHISFVLSPDENEKISILKLCNAVLYTPTNEHFGIVPIEAMAMSRPVIACNSGGPLETVIHEETGFLSPSEAESFAKHMLAVMRMDADHRQAMGEEGRSYVKRFFSYDRLRDQLKPLMKSLEAHEARSE